MASAGSTGNTVAVADRIWKYVDAYHEKRMTMQRVRIRIVAIERVGEYGDPSLSTVYMCFMLAATKESVLSGKARLPTFGHVLAYSLQLQQRKKEIVEGVASFCKYVIDNAMWKHVPVIWGVAAEVLSNAHNPKEGTFVFAKPTLNDFKSAFLEAENDPDYPYQLFAMVLKRSAEIYFAIEKNKLVGRPTTKLELDFEPIIKHMDLNKLDTQLKHITLDFNINLYTFLRRMEWPAYELWKQ